MAKAKLVKRRQASFPRRNALFWDTGDELVRYDGARGSVNLRSGKRLNLSSGDIY